MHTIEAVVLLLTSAKSQAPMATSLISQLGQRVHWGYQSRQHWARSFPVTTPKRAEIICVKIAIRLASPTTHWFHHTSVKQGSYTSPARQRLLRVRLSF
jgi:hypothetical protein